MVFGRVDKQAGELAMLACGRSVGEVSRHLVNKPFSLYTIQSSLVLYRPIIRGFGIDQIIRDAYTKDTIEKEMVTKALAMKGVADPHALYAGGAHPAGGGGASSDGEGGNSRGRRFQG